MLRELLNNLIDNALRYTQQQGSVTVRVREDQERALAIIEVEDNGPGITAGERELVFDRVDIFSNPRSLDPRFPGCLFRISFKLLRDPDQTDTV